MVKRYKKDELTVVWKPDLCIHSGKCVMGLNKVFDRTKHPWINMDGSGKERIIEQVKRCPSGALSYELENRRKEE